MFRWFLSVKIGEGARMSSGNLGETGSPNRKGASYVDKQAPKLQRGKPGTARLAQPFKRGIVRR